MKINLQRVILFTIMFMFSLYFLISSERTDVPILDFFIRYILLLPSKSFFIAAIFPLLVVVQAVWLFFLAFVLDKILRYIFRKIIN